MVGMVTGSPFQRAADGHKQTHVQMLRPLHANQRLFIKFHIRVITTGPSRLQFLLLIVLV